MSIDFESEIVEITIKLTQVKGYFDCEKIIIYNIKKQLTIGITDDNIIKYLKNLSVDFNKKIEINQGNADCANYRYATSFVDTLLKMPYWKDWMETINI